MTLKPLSLNLNKSEDSLEFLEDEVFDISEFLIDPDEEVPEPIPIIAFEHKGRTIPIFTEDNISMIQGRAKSRKSTVLKAIGATIASQGYYKHGKLLKSYYERNDFTIIDTEQGKYHCWKSAKVIKNISGKKIKYYKVAGLSVDKKKKLVEEHLKQNPKCGILVIDNIVHFLLNYNDPTESAQLNEWLIKIKADYNCHIILVLHENGSDMGNGKAKGHLGSLLENTCETIIRVEKDKNNRSRSIVSPKEMRGEEFDSFVIEMDFQGIPYISILEEHEQGKMKI